MKRRGFTLIELLVVIGIIGVLAAILLPALQRDESNVLFHDGHVEFMEYPGKFPMTEKFIKALESLDELKVAE